MPRVINIILLYYTIIIVPIDVRYCVPLLSLFLMMVLQRKKIGSRDNNFMLTEYHKYLVLLPGSQNQSSVEVTHYRARVVFLLTLVWVLLVNAL